MFAVIFWLFAVMVTTLFWRRFRKAARIKKRLSLIDDMQYPAYLHQRLQKHHPELTASQIHEVFLGLNDYFKCCLLAPKHAVAMPSQVVDSAWHELILNTAFYQNFCQRIFGRFLHHTPTEAMKTRTAAQQGIKRAWRISCRLEGINPHQPDRLPRLFALDSLLKIPNGFYYTLNCQGPTQSDKNQQQNNGCGSYCATHISCSSGCSSAGSGCNNSGGSDSDGGSSCGSSCGGGD